MARIITLLLLLFSLGFDPFDLWAGEVHSQAKGDDGLRQTGKQSREFDSRQRTKIDSILTGAIRDHVTPGAVVLVLQGGHIVYHRAFGHHTYDNQVPTRSSDIFDLASITKISATTLAVMRLVEQGVLDLDTGIGTYLVELQTTHPDKAAIRVRDLLTHQAGFPPFLAFHQNLKKTDCCREPSPTCTTEVAAGYYLRDNFFREVMWPRIMAVELKTPGQYVYSDLSGYVLQEIVERLTGKGLDTYLEEQFYRPLGLATMGFRPLERFPAERIVPTEIDNYFRQQTLVGFVQDPGAALAGGVAGHAGLFATAQDLAVIGQMLLNGGSYDGRQYFNPETVRLFTSHQSEVSRRGLGFDRWDPELDGGYPSRLASQSIFGHSGYTGTCLWVDPEQELVFVFLSNSTYPIYNRKLVTMNIRPRVLDAVYEALLAGKDELAYRAKGHR